MKCTKLDVTIKYISNNIPFILPAHQKIKIIDIKCTYVRDMNSKNKINRLQILSLTYGAISEIRRDSSSAERISVSDKIRFIADQPRCMPGHNDTPAQPQSVRSEM